MKFFFKWTWKDATCGTLVGLSRICLTMIHNTSVDVYVTEKRLHQSMFSQNVATNGDLCPNVRNSAHTSQWAYFSTAINRTGLISRIRAYSKALLLHYADHDPHAQPCDENCRLIPGDMNDVTTSIYLNCLQMHIWRLCEMNAKAWLYPRDELPIFIISSMLKCWKALR